jgi:hypothetical protein
VWPRVRIGSIVMGSIMICSLSVGVGQARAATPWQWPVMGPIIRGFDPPDDPYGAGHRGIDIAVPVETVILAPDGGIVTFAGQVGGRVFLTIDHGGGVLSTCSFLTAVMVHRGDHVTRGQAVATTGWGHADVSVAHLHLGVRLDGSYVDPLLYLGSPSVSNLIRLAPLEATAARSAAASSAASRMTHLAYPTMARAARAWDPGAARDPGDRADERRRPVAAVSRRAVPQRTRPGWHSRPAVRRVVASRDGPR